MLVTGLKDSALFKVISSTSNNGSCSSTHDALLQCVRDMLTKYEEKQGSDRRLKIKTQATQELMHALCHMPENQGAAISSALDRHAEALQGNEHLLSERGNTYALIQQTKGLRAGDAHASLLRYHDLKNKLLGPDTLLNAQQINAIRALDEKQGLTLKMLEIMEMFPVRTSMALVTLHEADLLEPEVCAIVLEHKDPTAVAGTLLRLKKAGLSKAQLSGLCAELCKHEDKDLGRAANALEELQHRKLDTPDNCSAVLKHSNPPSAANAIIYLHDNPLFSNQHSFFQPLMEVMQDRFPRDVMQHENPFMVARALVILDIEDFLLVPGIWTRVLRHKEPDEVARDLVELKRNKLDRLDNCLALIEQENTSTALIAMRYLHSCNLLTRKNRDQVFKHKQPVPAAIALEILDKANLCTPSLSAEVLKHEEPQDAARALVELYQHKLYTSDNWSVVFKHKFPILAALGIIHLHSCDLFTSENLEQVIVQENPYVAAQVLVILKKAKLFSPELYAKMLKHQFPVWAAIAMKELNEAGLFKPDFYNEVLEHKYPSDVVLAFVELNQHNLATAANRAAVLKKDYPCIAARIITHLHSCDLLTDENRDQVLKHERTGLVVEAFEHLGKNLCTQNNLDAVVNHPNICALTSGLRARKEAGKLEQGSFEACLAETRLVAMT